MLRIAEKYFLYTADLGIKLMLPDGSMPPGRNGPYNDIETPVRNTSHWMVIFSVAYQLTRTAKYKSALIRNTDFLTSSSSRPNGFSFEHRLNSHKDKCNGLIGQAWTLLGLAVASKVLSGSSCLLLAREVYSQHRFDRTLGLWHRLEVTGRQLSLDPTLNHQIWFAAAGSALGGRAEQDSRIFLDRLSSHLTVLPDGLIYHPILSLWYPQITPGLFGKLKIFTPVVEISGYKVPYSLHSQILIKSKGYHLFNLYGLAILSHRFPRHKIWQDSRINSALTLIIKKKFTSGLSANPYAFPYNPPGFEIGLVVDRFLPGNVAARNLARSMLLAQIKYIQDNQNSPKIDYHTLLARSYELSGLKSSV